MVSSSGADAGDRRPQIAGDQQNTDDQQQRRGRNGRFVMGWHEKSRIILMISLYALVVKKNLDILTKYI